MNTNFAILENRQAFTDFEDSETTCSYMLRNKNGFLRGKSYGEALYFSLSKIGVNRYSHILEIGGGRGDLALNFLNTLKAKKKDFHYSILDQSPDLIKGQKRVLSGFSHKVRWIEGNVKDEKNYETRHPYDLVMANELIGYLDVQIVASGQKIHFLDEEVSKIVEHYSKLIQTPLILPIGLINLLKGLDKKTSSEVSIVLSEYFTKVGGGSVMNGQGQREFCLNIHFVMDLIRALGFEVESYPMLDFLDFDLNFKPLSKDVMELITARLPEINRQIDSLSKGAKVHGDLSFTLEQDFLMSPAEWINKLSNYSFLILRKKKTFEWFGELDYCKAILSKNVAIFRQEEDYYLIRNSPQILMDISEEDLKLIKLIKKGVSVAKLLKEVRRMSAHPDSDIHTLNRLQEWFEKGIITLTAS